MIDLDELEKLVLDCKNQVEGAIFLLEEKYPAPEDAVLQLIKIAKASKGLETALKDAAQVILDNLKIENCSCHINPPCSACVDGPMEYQEAMHALDAYRKEIGVEL